MEKLIGTYDVTNEDVTNGDLFSPVATTASRAIPERLRKHNSIDMTSIVSCGGDNFNIDVNTTTSTDIPHIVEEGLIEPVHDENIVESAAPITAINFESNDEISLSFQSCFNDVDNLNNESDDAVKNLTVDGYVSHDENNNETTSSIPECSPSIHGDDEETDTTRKSPVNLFVANIVDYGRSDISSDSDADKQSFSRNRRKRILQRRSRTSAEYDNDRVHKDGGSINGGCSNADSVDGNKSNISTKSDSLSSCEGRSKSGSDMSGKRRRHGVSAEPVRVSWSTLRESFKLLQMSSTMNDLEQENVGGDEGLQNVDEGELGGSRRGNCIILFCLNMFMFIFNFSLLWHKCHLLISTLCVHLSLSSLCSFR